MVVLDPNYADQLEKDGMQRISKLKLSKSGQSFQDIP